ncbi:MAG: PorT family protein [Gemmatimonadota bacterium]|nr:MAG: PorT family protein [Gemmatimonadota bacterium]
MKTTVVAALALLLVMSVTDTTLAQRLSVGARGGYSSTTVGWRGLQAIETDWNSNYHIGGLLKLAVHENFAIQLETWYAKKGTGARFLDDDIEGDYDLAYLQIPLLAQVMVPLGPDSRVAPHFFAGPTIAFELSCEISAVIGGMTVRDDCDAPDLDLERKTTDIGLLLGGGIEIQIGPGSILLDAMYDLGLANLNDDPEAADDSVKSKAWMVSAGYLIPITAW